LSETYKIHVRKNHGLKKLHHIDIFKLATAPIKPNVRAKSRKDIVF